MIKLGKGGTILTDGCSTATKQWRLLREQIIEMAKQAGIPESEIHIFEGDCWQHMHNVWFGAIINHLGSWLDKCLELDLYKILKFYQDSTSIV